MVQRFPAVYFLCHISTTFFCSCISGINDPCSKTVGHDFDTMSRFHGQGHLRFLFGPYFLILIYLAHISG